MIAVLLATYNGEKYLEAQLNSLINQTYHDFQIYISDDCSTDGTVNIISKYEDIYPGKIINIKNGIHFGNAKDNFLFLVESVQADIYFFCDQDDVWNVDKIEKTLKVYNHIEDKSLPILIHSDLAVVNEKLEIINESFFNFMGLKKNITDYKSLLVQNYVTGCTMMVNKALVDFYMQKKNLINKSNILMHDYFFAIIASIFGNLYFCDQSLMLYRQHQSNSVGAKNVKSVEYAFNKIKEISKNKNIVRKTQFQIHEIFEMVKDMDSLPGEIKELLYEYSILYKKNKLWRMMFIVKNGLLKKGLKRKVYQMIAI